MESGPVFDLERAIHLWRRRLSVRQGFRTQDIDEMESHLRDEIDELVADGLSPREGFVRATKGFGQEADLVNRFRWANWEKVFAKRLADTPMCVAVNLKLAYRNIVRHAGFSTISLLGLATGIACSIVILLYVGDELSYDRFHADAERIYRVVAEQTLADETISPRIVTPGALTDAMLRELPEIDAATRVLGNGWGKVLVTNTADDSYYGDNVLFVEDSFFDLFSFHFVEGDPNSAFDDPASVVLTGTLAKRFFDNGEALGQSLVLNGRAVQVTGVIEDVPRQSHLQFDFLASIVWWRPAWLTSWETPGTMYSYIKVHRDASLEKVNAKIQELVDANKSRQTECTYSIQPLTGFNGVHLSPLGDAQITGRGSRLYIKVLLMVGVFMLLIAGINYVNLATARSAVRAKEIGVRKVVGAMRRTLVTQFLTESTLVSLVAGIIAVITAALVLPFFNDLMQKDLSVLAPGTGSLWIVTGGAVLLFGVAAGLYPAFYLSSFRPTSIFAKHPASGRTGLGLRRLLVIAQFALTAFMLIGMLVVRQQMDFVRSANLGFDANQVIVIPRLSAPNRDQDYVVRNALESIPGVERAGGFFESIIGTRDYGATGAIRRKGSNSSPVASMAQVVDDRYLEVLGVEFKEGRNFSLDHPADLTDGIILNETAVRQMGIQGPAVGQEIVTNSGATRVVIGVVEDFHASSLHREITPFSFLYHPAALQAVLKLSGGHIAETLKNVAKTLSGFVPYLPFDFYFLDETIDQQYRADREFQVLFAIMTGLIVIIACMGLVGLAAATASQRTKEIALRKVVGAAVASLVGLLSRDFAKLVIIANLIAWPVAYLAMDRWLSTFAYRIDMGPETFLLAGFLAVGIALTTVCAQTLRVTLANPIDALAHTE